MSGVLSLSDYCAAIWDTESFSSTEQVRFNTSRPRQNGRRFADDVFKCIFLNENEWTLIEIWLKFVPKGTIGNMSTFFGSGNGLAPSRRQAIIWTNDG